MTHKMESMNFRITYLFAVLVSFGTPLLAQVRPDVPPVGATLSTRNVVAHDPVMIHEGGTYYLFTTGPGISVWSSKDMKQWTHRESVFDPYPAWVPVEIPRFQGHLWAPDIVYYDGLYYLYYSASAFGINLSAIGLATNKTLDSTSPDYKWVDHGKILQSYPTITDWNAIDAQVIEDDDGTPYMTFGSFWGGIKIARLSSNRMALAEAWQNLPTIASRVSDREGSELSPGSNAIEAPFIFKHENYYYLFASIDFCCRGRDSNYKVIVGRSSSIQGPYVDSKGQLLTQGGGDVILAPDEHWYGVGHNAVYNFDGVDYIIYHGYDASDGSGDPKLIINRLRWSDEGWPIVVHSN